MTPSTDSSRPSLVVALFGEAALGLVVGVVLGLLAAIASSYIAMWTGWAEQLGMGLLAVQLFTGLAGFVVGLALGIHFVGQRMRQGGNGWWALVGGLLGILPVILFASRGAFGSFQGAVGWGLVLAVLGALVGYNLTPRPT